MLNNYLFVVKVMHHKWDAHPYCVVAHVTLQAMLLIPPNDMMYPQLGKGLRRPPPPGRRRASKYSQTQAPDFPGKCTKCDGTDFGEGDYAGFAAHVLECGGDENWDDSSSGKRKKGERGKKSKRVLTEEERAREREKRQARMARFALPGSRGGSRTTRFQIAMVQREEEEERMRKERELKAKRPKKSSKAKVKKQPLAAPALEAPPPPPTPKSTAARREDPESGTSSPLPDRPRRSTVNYARDRSLRDGVWLLRAPNQEEEIESVLREEEAKTDEEEEQVDVEALPEGGEEPNVSEEVTPDEKGAAAVGQKRRASCSLVLQRGAPQRKAARLSLDSRVQMEHRPEKQRNGETSQGGRGRSRRNSPSASAAETSPPRPTPASNGVKVEHETKETRKADEEEEDEDDAPLIRLKLPGKAKLRETAAKKKRRSTLDNTDSRGKSVLRPSPRKKRVSPTNGPALATSPASQLPAEEKLAEVAQRSNGNTRSDIAKDLQCSVSTVSAVKRRRSTLDNTNSRGESPSRPSPRKRRVSSASGLALATSSGSVFPIEVKLAALDRMSKGDTPSAIAKDLQCPVSTVSSWWYRRNSGILSKKTADGLNSSGEDSPDSRNNGFSSDSNSPSPATANEPPSTSEMGKSRILVILMKDLIKCDL